MKYLCVVSHTHWDREWYMPFEQFRVRLVELIDRLLIILEDNPEYIFHLDAQTIVLEDYLEIRSSKKDVLKKYISEGRIVVGPWYLQNDFYLTSGEATVRNLLTGTAISKEFGACGKAGYAPDQFGNISQLPQILKNFDIDNFIFGRGFGKYYRDENGAVVREKTPSEFIWKGADGTEVLAVHMKYWYNNAQRLSSNMEAVMPLINNIEMLFENVAVTPYLLLMNGVDHLEAQDDLLDVLAQINSNLPKDKIIKQYDMYQYIQRVGEYINDNNISLHVHNGELRDGNEEILNGTLSSRHYLKVSNVKAQNMLEYRLEPMYSLFELAGAKGVYAKDHLNYLWKQLLKNHPHDSICGCSRDAVHAHMEDNYLKINEMGSYLLKKLGDNIAFHMDIKSENTDDNLIALINTTQLSHNAVIEVEIMFLVSEEVNGFIITDKEGNEIDFAVKSTQYRRLDIFTALNLPGVIGVTVYNVYLYVENINAFSIKGLIVKKTDSFKNMALCNENNTVLDNNLIKVEVTASGKVNFTSYKTGFTAQNIINIEETCDRGDSYLHFCTEDKPLYGTDFPVTIEILENNRFVKKCRIKYTMEVPEYYDFDQIKRSENKAICPVELILTLKKGSETIEIEYTVDNTAKDHRIRLLVDTNIISETSIADIPFDIVYRTFNDNYINASSNVHPNTSFATIRDDNNGMAVFTEGAHEYEHIKNKKSVLAFTLLRATGVISRGSDLNPSGGSEWDIPQNQCIRKINGRVGLYLYDGHEEKLSVLSTLFRNPVTPNFVSVDNKKFAGGRHAVQGSVVSEFFYLPDIYSDVRIKDNQSYLKVEGEGVLVTAFKKSETGNGYVLRLVNMKNEKSSITVYIKGKIYKSNMGENTKEYLSSDKLEYCLHKKEIATFFIDF